MDVPLDEILRWLAPLLPYLIRAGQTAADEAGRRLVGTAWEGVRAAWAKIRARESVARAAQDLASHPDDPDAQAALRFQIRKALAEDPALAEELAGLLQAREVHLYIHPAPPPVPERPRPLHNLPQPDYVRFVGREEELAWLRQRLSPSSRVWVIALTGIGGVGKTALALKIAHEYRERYGELPPEERFDASSGPPPKSRSSPPPAPGPPALRASSPRPWPRSTGPSPRPWSGRPSPAPPPKTRTGRSRKPSPLIFPTF
ncbi:MAG: ATP-binding protein [Thermoflexales bacterium]|nr:ATP-binding protein [Thermoflexales bacterium]